MAEAKLPGVRAYRRWRTLSWQISSMVIGVVAFSLLLNSVLTYFNFEKSYMALLRSRLDVVGSDINRSIEFGLTLGLHLEEMRQLQSVVDAAQRQRAGIGAIAVLDRDGVSLFDTDKRRIGKADFTAWLAPKAGAKAASGWQAVDGQDYWIAIPVKNSFNARAGTVMIGYSRALVDNKLHATQFALARNFVLVLAGFALLAILGTHFINRSLIGKLNRLEALLAGEAGPGVEADGDEALEAGAVGYQGRVQSLLAEIRALDAQVAAFEQEQGAGS